jgi:hypothetical protein
MCDQEAQSTSDLVRRDPDCEAMSQNSCKRTRRVVIREQVLGYLIRIRRRIAAKILKPSQNDRNGER